MRIIDADELVKKALTESCFDSRTEDVFLDLVDSMPTVDAETTFEAELVRHATWETVLYEQSGRLNSYAHACPRCKYVYKDFKPIGHNYCPKCGAIMDGGVSDEG